MQEYLLSNFLVLTEHWFIYDSRIDCDLLISFLCPYRLHRKPRQSSLYPYTHMKVIFSLSNALNQFGAFLDFLHDSSYFRSCFLPWKLRGTKSESSRTAMLHLMLCIHVYFVTCKSSSSNQVFRMFTVKWNNRQDFSYSIPGGYHWIWFLLIAR